MMDSNLLQGEFKSAAPELPADGMIYVADDVTVAITPTEIIVDFSLTGKPDVVIARQKE